MLLGCGSQASGSPNSPSHTAQPGWKTYVSTRWGYSVDYPADWYNLPNFGAPDTSKYFSNENVGAPVLMSSRGVWETIEVQPNSTGSCPPSIVSTYVIRKSPTTVDGVATTRYVSNVTPSGTEPAYTIGVWVTHSGSCYSLQFVSMTPSTRDASSAVTDQTIASFHFSS